MTTLYMCVYIYIYIHCIHCLSVAKTDWTERLVIVYNDIVYNLYTSFCGVHPQMISLPNVLCKMTRRSGDARIGGVHPQIISLPNVLSLYTMTLYTMCIQVVYNDIVYNVYTSVYKPFSSVSHCIQWHCIQSVYNDKTTQLKGTVYNLYIIKSFCDSRKNRKNLGSALTFETFSSVSRWENSRAKYGICMCVCVGACARTWKRPRAKCGMYMCVCVCVCVRAHTRGNVSKVSSAVIVHMKLSSKLTFCEFSQKVSSPINFVGARANVSKLSSAVIV